MDTRSIEGEGALEMQGFEAHTAVAAKDTRKG